MTPSDCKSGSDKVAEASKEIKADIAFTSATKIKKLEEHYDPNIVKIVFNKDGYTLYSSRALIPYPSLHFSKYFCSP